MFNQIFHYMYFKWIVLLLSVGMTGNQLLKAQGIYVESSNGETVSINAGSVVYGNFPQNNLTFKLSDNTSKTFSLLEVKKIFFADNTGNVEVPSSDNSLIVLPNPATSILQILNVSENPAQVFIYSLQGQMLFTTTVTPNANQVDVTNLKKGMYLLRMRNRTAKFVKQ